MADRSGARWWEGVASPGPAGYALAVALSVPVLGVLVVVLQVVSDGTAPRFAAGDTPDVGVLFGLFWGVVVFGSVFALVLAPPGVLVVHLLCSRTTRQWVHVVLAGLAGVVVGGLFVGDLGDGFAAALGLATAVGRACVVPLVPGRGRRARRPAPAAG